MDMGVCDEDDDGVKGAGDEADGQCGRDEQERGECEADDAGSEPTRRADEAPCSVRVTETGSDVCLEARLNRPFDQLASARLRAVARIAALRKSPTSTGGGRRSSAETATEAVSQGEGLYSDAVVRKKGLEPSRPKAPEPKSGASANSATRAVRLTLPLLEPAMFPKSPEGECA